MKLEVIVKALKWLEIDMDVDEVISLVSSSFFPTFNLFVSFKKQIKEDVSVSDELIFDAFAGRVYNGHTDIQESCERLLCPQKQSGCIEQARPFPQVKWKTCQFIRTGISSMILNFEVQESLAIAG